MTDSQNTRRALRAKGLDTERTNPSDDAEFDGRVRRGLRGENTRAFGGRAAQGTIRSRVRGDAMGRRDERR